MSTSQQSTKEIGKRVILHLISHFNWRRRVHFMCTNDQNKEEERIFFGCSNAPQRTGVGAFRTLLVTSALELSCD